MGNGWTEDYPSYSSVEGGRLKIDSETNLGTAWKQVHHSVDSPGTDYVIEFNGLVNQTDKYTYANYFGEQSNRRSAFAFGDASVIKYLNSSTFEDTSFPYSVQTKYEFSIYHNRSSGKSDYYVNGNLEAERSDPGSSVSYINEIAFGGISGSLSYWDDVRIRKSVSSEPLVHFFGEVRLNSSLEDTGPTNISGYMTVEVESNQSGDWTHVSIRLNDSDTQSIRSVASSGFLDINGIWDPWDTDSYQSGWYRVKVYLTDINDNVLTNDTGGNISSSKKFFVDTENPKWSQSGTNDSYPIKGGMINLYSYWTDNRNLRNWTFSWNATASGLWENMSSGNFTGTGNWSNTTQTVLPSLEDTYGYRFYAWDDLGNMNVTDILTFSVAGYLEVNLITPIDSTIVAQNTTFLANATVYCREGYCGQVSGRIRYNGSSQYPDTDISESFAKPFYTMGDPNPADCLGNPLEKDEYCNITWTVNATGDIGSYHEVGAFLESDLDNVPENSTSGRTVNIVSCILDITVQWDSISFGLLTPGDRGNASGNDNGEYNITVEDVTTCGIDVYLQGTDLENSSLGYTINAENISWNNVSNDYGSSYPMSSSWQLVGGGVEGGTNLTTWYWIDVPFGVGAGNYNGTVTIEGVEAGESP